MARLSMKSEAAGARLLELKLGVTRIGRSPDVDFQIQHATVSSLHCELCLVEGGVLLRDLNSTNGTFVDGEPVQEKKLKAGQTVRLGEVELLVDTTDVAVSIPKFVDVDLPAPPVVADDGTLICPRHDQAQARFQCSECKEVMCDACVHRLRRRGSKNVLLLCPVCGKTVEPIGGPKQRAKKSFFARAGETVKLKLARALHLTSEK